MISSAQYRYSACIDHQLIVVMTHGIDAYAMVEKCSQSLFIIVSYYACNIVNEVFMTLAA